MIIAVDVDNTICNLQEAVINLFNERNGSNYTTSDFNAYTVENVLPLKEAVIMKQMYSESNIYDFVWPLDGSRDALQKLINEGHQVYLVTDAAPENYNEKIDWIRHFFPFIDLSHIVSMKHKHLFKCDVMVEDNVQNLIAGQHYERICLNYPWNKQIHDEAYGIYRCNNWNEIMNVINKINTKERV